MTRGRNAVAVVVVWALTPRLAIAFETYAGVETGRWKAESRAGEVVRRISGTRLAVRAGPTPRWPLAAELGWRQLDQRVDAESKVIADGGPTTAPSAFRSHAVSLLVAFALPQFELAAGGAWTRRPDPQGAKEQMRPVARIRVGRRDSFFAEAAANDVAGARPGLLRAGAGAGLGDAEMWLGYARDEDPHRSDSIAGAVQVPLSVQIGLVVVGAVHPTQPGRYLVLQVGLSWRGSAVAP